MSTERSAWTDARRAEAEVRHLRALLAENERLREGWKRTLRDYLESEAKFPTEAELDQMVDDELDRLAVPEERQ